LTQHGVLNRFRVNDCGAGIASVWMSCSATGRDRSDRTSGNTATASSSSCITDGHKRRGLSGDSE